MIDKAPVNSDKDQEEVQGGAESEKHKDSIFQYSSISSNNHPQNTFNIDPKQRN
jgi:hypothetical protein